MLHVLCCMDKYFSAYKISLSQMLEWRLDFWLQRAKSLVTLLLLYYVWWTVSAGGAKQIAGLSGQQLLMYVLGVHVLRSLVFGDRSRKMATEINDGTFSIYLIKPVKHFWFFFWQELAERTVLTAAAFLETLILSWLWKISWSWPGTETILLSALAIVLALFLYFLLSYFVSLIAFWSRESMGPRFLFEWFLEFASGAFFPLAIVPVWLFLGLAALPFLYLIYVPLLMYLGALSDSAMYLSLVWQIVWLVIIGVLCLITWRRGLRKYTGEGI